MHSSWPTPRPPRVTVPVSSPPLTLVPPTLFGVSDRPQQHLSITVARTAAPPWRVGGSRERYTEGGPVFLRHTLLSIHRVQARTAVT